LQVPDMIRSVLWHRIGLVGIPIMSDFKTNKWKQ
jgi:hypothetical protein